MTNLKFSAFIALIAFTFLVTILVEPLVAQEDTSQANEDLRIQFIEVEGSQRVEAETVRSYMILKPGMTADPVLLDQSLKSMFASGLFADVTIRRERGGLIVTVVENPIVNRVIFEGNDKLDDDGEWAKTPATWECYYCWDDRRYNEPPNTTQEMVIKSHKTNPQKKE